MKRKVPHTLTDIGIRKALGSGIYLDRQINQFHHRIGRFIDGKNRFMNDNIHLIWSVIYATNQKSW